MELTLYCFCDRNLLSLSRQLQERIDPILFKRTAISHKPENTIHHDLEQLRQDQQLSSDLLLKDPYILDFLDLSERIIPSKTTRSDRCCPSPITFIGI
ncbi:DUF1016 family protein [Pseudanabaena sp. PCC 6802]|uniref:DUF1016 family protein n=1 Tax=Pseudanabaena sp. PCC 6802 TaxID=118173 RepID=UPI000374F3A7|nr:DUF1016 family protein [Pseudanabaena sp. PCC 6802]